MDHSDSFQEEISRFPSELRELIEAELQAGNGIVEVSGCFPAPPAGAYVKLERPVSTRPRESKDGIRFYDRNSSSYSGEFADEKRFYFVLEPPHPPEPPPDMDAIRAGIEARYRALDAARFEEFRRGSGESSAVDRFRQSMSGNEEQWREGAGYDLSILKTLTAGELVEIENLLLARAAEDWRDIEAFAALNSTRARAAIRDALQSPDERVRLAVAQYAPELISKAERAEILVRALEDTDTHGGLTQALLEIESFHPPEIIDALLRGVLERGEGTPVHFAAMLMFLHGKAESAFDWDQRPFFLKFHTEDRGERTQLFIELCERIGVDPAPYLRSGDAQDEIEQWGR
jgi:hypothetical protein